MFLTLHLRHIVVGSVAALPRTIELLEQKDDGSLWASRLRTSTALQATQMQPREGQLPSGLRNRRLSNAAVQLDQRLYWRCALSSNARGVVHRVNPPKANYDHSIVYLSNAPT